MAGAITVRLPDGSTKELPAGTTALGMASSIGKRLAAAAVAAVVDGAEVDLDTVLADGAEVAVITADSDTGRAVVRHSTSHVLAQAVLDLWPGAQYAIGPAIADGFYYDFSLPGGATFSDDDLERIGARMREIMAEDQAFVRQEHSFDDGLALFADQPFKREIISGVASDCRPAGGGGGRHRPSCGRGHHLQKHRPLRRPVPGAACPVHRPARALRAVARGRRLLARRREAAPASAHLRHRLGVGQCPGRPSAPPRGGRAPRPPSPGGGAGPLLLPERDRFRVWPSSTRRARPSGG